MRLPHGTTPGGAIHITIDVNGSWELCHVVATSPEIRGAVRLMGDCKGEMMQA